MWPGPIIGEKAREFPGARTDLCQRPDESSIDLLVELVSLAAASYDTTARAERVNTCKHRAPIEAGKADDCGLRKVARPADRTSGTVARDRGGLASEHLFLFASVCKNRGIWGYFHAFEQRAIEQLFRLLLAVRIAATRRT